MSLTCAPMHIAASFAQHDRLKCCLGNHRRKNYFMKKIVKYKYWVGGIIVLILLLTNPSMKKFENFAGQKNAMNGACKKNYNFLLFSIYSDNSMVDYERDRSSKFEEYSKFKIHKHYVGMLMNFVEVTQTKERTNEY